MATLFVSIIALVLITLATLFANRTALFEQVTSANHHRYSRAFEAAQGGLDYAIAWLGTNGNPNCNPDPTACTYTIATGATGAAWVSDTAGHPPYNEKNTTSIPAQTLGGYTATITLWRNSASPQLVEIVSTVAIDSSLPNNEAGATVRQVVNVVALGFTSPNQAPMTVNGCIQNILGNPTVSATPSSSPAIVSSTGPVGSSCLDTNSGHLTLTGQVVPNGFSGSAWDQTFKISKEQMLALAKKQAGGAVGGPIYFYDYVTNTPSDPWHTSLGDAAHPVILIFNNPAGSDCPKINGGPTINGIVYCNSGQNMQGTGGTQINGSLVVDSTITKLNANITINTLSAANNPGNYNVQPIISKVSGSWRDF